MATAAPTSLTTMDEDELQTICAFYNELVDGQEEEEEEEQQQQQQQQEEEEEEEEDDNMSIHNQSDITDSANNSTNSSIMLSSEKKGTKIELGRDLTAIKDESHESSGDQDQLQYIKNESLDPYMEETIKKIRSVCTDDVLAIFESQLDEIIRNVCSRISKLTVSGLANILAEAYKANMRFLHDVTDESIVSTVEIVLKAAAVYYLSLQSLNVYDEIDTVEELLQEYSEYELFAPNNIDPEEGHYLLIFRNFMKKALQFVPAKKNKATLVYVCALLEGSKRKYKKGGTQNVATTRREMVYEHETGFRKKSRVKKISARLNGVDMTETTTCICGTVILKHKMLKHVQQKKHKKILSARGIYPQPKPVSIPLPLPMLSASVELNTNPSTSTTSDRPQFRAGFIPVQMSSQPQMQMQMVAISRDGQRPAMVSMLPPWGFQQQSMPPPQMAGGPAANASQMQYFPMGSFPFMMVRSTAQPPSSSSSSEQLPPPPPPSSSSSSSPRSSTSDQLPQMYLSWMPSNKGGK